MTIFGYTLFAFSLFYLFFLWQFPYEGVKKAIIQSFAETLPLNLSIERVGPSFPLQLHLEKINIRSNTLLLQIPDLTVQPNFINFIWGRTNIYVKDLPTSQRLQGEFISDKNQNRMKIQLNNLEIKAFLPNEFSVPVKLSGEATLQWVGENFEKLNGQAWALLQRGEIQGIPNPRLPFPLALLETVRAEIQIQEGNLRVKRLVGSGKDLKEIVLKDFQIPLSGLEKGAFPDLSLFFQLTPK
jgi:type II secretion system protein N